MKYLPSLLFLGAIALPAQTAISEDDALRRAMSDSNNSPQGYTRELEVFLQQFPNAQRRPEVENLLFRSALNLKDIDRIARYGETILMREPDNVIVLENVITAELKLGKEQSYRQALSHAQHLEQVIQRALPASGSGPEEARRRVDSDRTLARAYIYLARADGMLGKTEDAVLFAEKSFDAFPTAESAREAAHWLSAQGRNGEAARYLADAFIMPDTKATDDERSEDRRKLSELYQKWKGTDTGLGDFVLAEYDRTSALLAERRMALKQVDPNLQAATPLEFTLTAFEGAPLKLSTLQGKVIVMDFWATWCGPCRIQHPLYEQVKAKFRDRPDVVFLAVNADDDHKSVGPFLQAQGWSHETYFEDGLAVLLRVSSLPTTLILDKSGKVMDRMVGFLPDRFADQLTKQIMAALNQKEGAQGGG